MDEWLALALVARPMGLLMDDGCGRDALKAGGEALNLASPLGLVGPEKFDVGRRAELPAAVIFRENMD